MTVHTSVNPFSRMACHAAASTGLRQAPHPVKPLAVSAADSAPLPAKASTSIRPTEAGGIMSTQLLQRSNRSEQMNTPHFEPSCHCSILRAPCPRSQVPDKVIPAREAWSGSTPTLYTQDCSVTALHLKRSHSQLSRKLSQCRHSGSKAPSQTNSLSPTLDSK